MVIELNISVEDFKGRLDHTEEKISDLEDTPIELSNMGGKKNGKERSLKDRETWKAAVRGVSKNRT